MSTQKLLNTFEDIKTFMDSLVAGNYLLKAETNYHAGQGRNKLLNAAELSKLVALPVITQAQVDDFTAAYDRGDWNLAIVSDLNTNDPLKLASASTVFDLKEILDSINAELAANVAKKDEDNNFSTGQTIQGDLNTSGIVTSGENFGFSIGGGALNSKRVLHRNGANEYVFYGADNELSGIRVNASILSETSATSAAPTLSFGDTDTGLYESADDTLNVSTAGVSRLSVSTTDIISDLPLTVNGTITTNSPFGVSLGNVAGKARLAYSGDRFALVKPDNGWADLNVGRLHMSAGGGVDTAADPTLAFGNDGTGLYESADNVLNISTGTVSRLSISTTDIISDLPLTATSFTKTGGTSSQFLKADGSIDENVYALDAEFSDYAKLDGSNMPFTGDIAVDGRINLAQGSGITGDTRGMVLHSTIPQETRLWLRTSDGRGDAAISVYDGHRISMIFNNYETGISAQKDGAASLYYDNSLKLSTNASGAEIIGDGHYLISKNDSDNVVSQLGADGSGDGYFLLRDFAGNNKVLITGDSSVNYITAGNLGIGTNVASNKLTVANNDTNTNTALNATVSLFNNTATADNLVSIAFAQNGLSSNSHSRLGVIFKDRTSGSEDQDMFFSTMGNGAYGERMRILSTGNVLINETTDTGDKLYVNGHIGTKRLILRGGVTNLITLAHNNGDLHLTNSNGGAIYQGITISGAEGRVGIGTTPLGQLHVDGGTGTLSTGLVFGDGDTGFFEVADDSLGISFNGNHRYSWTVDYFHGQGATGAFALQRFPGSATDPSYTFVGDFDTGLGRAAADELSLIAGGVEAVRVEASGGTLNGNWTATGNMDLNGQVTFNTQLNFHEAGSTSKMMLYWNDGSDELRLYGKSDGATLADGNIHIYDAIVGSYSRTYINAQEGKINNELIITAGNIGTYTSAEADTLDSVTGRGNTTLNPISVGNLTVGGDIDVSGEVNFPGANNRVFVDVNDEFIIQNKGTYSFKASGTTTFLRNPNIVNTVRLDGTEIINSSKELINMTAAFLGDINGDHTEVQASGVYFDRAASYLRPKVNNAHQLYIGAFDGLATWNAVNVHANAFNFNGQTVATVDQLPDDFVSKSAGGTFNGAVTVNTGSSNQLAIKDTSAGALANPAIAFKDSADVRLGEIGYLTSGDNRLSIANPSNMVQVLGSAFEFNGNEVYHAGNLPAYVPASGGTFSAGIVVQGVLQVDHSIMSVGANGLGSSIVRFFDDSADTYRGFRWDDASSEFKVEDSSGQLNTLIHAGNIGNFTTTEVDTLQTVTQRGASTTNAITATQFEATLFSSTAYDTIAYKFSEGRGWGYHAADNAVFYNAGNGITPMVIGEAIAVFQVPLKVDSDTKLNGLLKVRNSGDKAVSVDFSPADTRTGIQPVFLYRNSAQGTANYMLANGSNTYFGSYDSAVPTDASNMVAIQSSNSGDPELRVGDAGSTAAKLYINGDLAATQDWVNLQNYTTNDGTVTGVTVGTGLDVSSSTTAPHISLDFSEIAQAGTLQATDDFIVLDGSSARIKQASAIGLSIFNNDANFITLSDITGYASLNGSTSENFKVNKLTFTNNETTTASAAGDLVYDTNDSGAPALLGSFNDSAPIGLYVHDGTDLRRIWTTDHFGASHVANWQTAYGWGDHAGLYAADNHNHTGVYEPVFTKNSAYNKNFGTTASTVAQGNDSRILRGDTAHGWGDHANAGYLTSYTETDTLASVTARGNLTASNVILEGSEGAEIPRGINGAYSSGDGSDWGANIWALGASYNSSSQGTSFALGNHYGLAWLRATHANANSNVGEGLYIYKGGVLEVGLGSAGIYTDAHGNSNQWNTAYGWGNHASAGYITGVTAGTNLNGGGTAGDVTLNLDSNLTGINSITIDGILIDESDERSGLLEVHRDGATAWTGYAIDFDGQHWAFMGNATKMGLYDDSAADWILYATAGGGVDLRYSGDNKLSTTSAGGTLFDTWNVNGGLTIGGNAVATEDWVSSNFISSTETGLGLVGSQSSDTVTNTAAEWANLPVGYSKMIYNSIGTSGGAPVNNHGYFTKVANRDTGGGWAGLWVGYTTGENYIGRTGTSSSFASWEKLWTNQNDGAGSGLDADLLDGRQTSVEPSAHTIPVRDSSGYLHSGWINLETGTGLYTENAAYLYQIGTLGGWAARGTHASVSYFELQNLGGVSYGGIYADSSSIGFVAASAASWRLKVDSSDHLRVYGTSLYLNESDRAMSGQSEWLYLNPDGALSNGTYTPGLFRADNGLQVGSSGSDFRVANDGLVSLKTNLWHQSTDGKNRLYFANNSHTYLKTESSFYIRNASNANILTMSGSGHTTINGYIRSTYSGTYSPRYDTAFHTLQSQFWYSHSSSDMMYLGESGNTVRVRGELLATRGDQDIVFQSVNTSPSPDLAQFQIRHDSSDVVVDAVRGNLILEANVGVVLKYSSASRLVTTNSGVTVTGSVTASNFVDTSDSRLKEELNLPLPGLSLINKLEPKLYRKNDIVESGFYADQLPEEAAYMRHKIEGDYWGMDYKNLHAVQINAIKELNQKVQNLEKEKSDLEKRVIDLETKMEMLMQKLI